MKGQISALLGGGGGVSQYFWMDEGGLSQYSGMHPGGCLIYPIRNERFVSCENCLSPEEFSIHSWPVFHTLEKSANVWPP